MRIKGSDLLLVAYLCVIPLKEKWKLFSQRILACLGTAENLQVEVSIKAKVTAPTVKQQLNMALQDFDLKGEFKE